VATAHRDLRRYPGFGTLAWLCLAILYAPLVVIAVYSFNALRSITVWGGFSLAWYAKVLGDAAIQRATLNSLLVATGAAILSTALATAAAVATPRDRPMPLQATAFGLISLPLMAPEIVTAVASLIFFVLIGLKLGLLTILLAHVTFCIPFAYLPVSARLELIDPALEDAALDLYAGRWQAFRLVILPLLLPGVVAGFMLAFITSLDDFIITNFVAGPGATTLPLAIYGMVRVGFTPEINAISTILLAVSILFVAASYLIGRRRRDG
jgi:spermidine/putrescine transport system permease protein